jgi:hypothetical protein
LDLFAWQMLEPRVCGIAEVEWQVFDHEEVVGRCDNPPRKIPYYRLRPFHFGH